LDTRQWEADAVSRGKDQKIRELREELRTLKTQRGRHAT
jgi:hypothetical protein